MAVPLAQGPPGRLEWETPVGGVGVRKRGLGLGCSSMVPETPIQTYDHHRNNYTMDNSDIMNSQLHAAQKIRQELNLVDWP